MANDQYLGGVQLLVSCDTNSFVDAAAGRSATVAGSLSQASPTHTGFGNVGYINGAAAVGVRFPTSTDFCLTQADGDFTIEFWFYPNSANGGKTLFSFGNKAVSAGWILYGVGTIYGYGLSFQSRNSAGTVTGIFSFTDYTSNLNSNAWNHVALVREGSTTRLYVNGAQKYGSSANYANYNTYESAANATHTLNIGADYTGAAYDEPLQGAIDDIRYTRGVVRYPGGTTFTPPTEPNPISGTALFLPLATLGTAIVDSCGHVITNTGTASITSGTGHAGGANALYLDGSTQYLTTPTSAGMTMVGNTFTMEGWFKSDTGAGGVIRPLMNNGDGTSGGFKIEITAGDVLKAYVYCGATAIAITGATNVTVNAYHHFALNKASGDVFRLYLDGVEQGTSVTQGGSITAASATQIGYDGTNFFKGYLDDIRVLKGLSIYDAAFTPPAYNLTQLPANSGTGSPSLNAMTSSATQQAINTGSPALQLNTLTSDFTRTIYPWGAPALSLNAMTSSGVGRVPLVLATMSDTLNLSTTALPSLTAAVTMTSSLSLTTPTTAGNLLDGSLLSSLLSSTSLVGSHDQSVVWTEHLVIISTVDKSATGTAWVINANTKAVSMYDEYPFHSLIPHQGKFYGISDEGLFLLEGDDDDGSKIDAFVLTKKTDFGNTTLNRVPYVYAGADAPDGLTVAVHTDEGRFEYSAPATDGLQNTRAKIGMGLRSRFWQVELRNVDGGDMTIESLEVMPTKQDRRIK